MNEHKGRSKWYRCEPVLPRPRLSVGGVRAQGGAHRTEQPAEGNQSNGKKGTAVHARTPTPTFRRGVRAQGGARMDRAKGTKLCMPELPRPHFSVGIVRATRRHAQWAKAEARSERGWGDATAVINVSEIAGQKLVQLWRHSSSHVSCSLSAKTSVLSVSLYSHVHCRQSCTHAIAIATPLIKHMLKQMMIALFD